MNSVLKKTRFKYVKGDTAFDIINYTILVITLIMVLYPLYFILIASVSDPTAVVSGQVILSVKGFSLNGYKRIFEDDLILRSYGNSILYTLLGTFINISLTITVAYSLSRKVFSGKKFITVFFMITMYFHGGMIPGYLLVQKLGLINKWYVMVLTGGVSVFNIIIAKSFLQSSIPKELFDAASIDGCNHFQYFQKFILPLSKPIMTVLILYYGIANWNEYMKALLYLSDENLFPLQMVLRRILIENQTQGEMVGDITSIAEKQKLADLIKYGSIVVASLPALMIYPFLQKYFDKGVMIGSVKG